MKSFHSRAGLFSVLVTNLFNLQVTNLSITLQPTKQSFSFLVSLAVVSMAYSALGMRRRAPGRCASARRLDAHVDSSQRRWRRRPLSQIRSRVRCGAGQAVPLWRLRPVRRVTRLLTMARGRAELVKTIAKYFGFAENSCF